MLLLTAQLIYVPKKSRKRLFVPLKCLNFAKIFNFEIFYNIKMKEFWPLLKVIKSFKLLTRAALVTLIVQSGMSARFARVFRTTTRNTEPRGSSQRNASQSDGRRLPTRLAPRARVFCLYSKANIYVCSRPDKN